MGLRLRLRSAYTTVGFATFALGGLRALPAQDSTAAVAREPEESRSVRMLAVGAVSAATWTQVIGMPEQWPRTWRGYGSRLGDQVGFIASEELLRYSLEKAVPWHSAACANGTGAAHGGTWMRLRRAASCAISSTFVAHNRAGERRPNLPVLGSIIGATAVSLAWRPERADAHKGQLFLLTRAGIVTGATVMNRGVKAWRRP